MPAAAREHSGSKFFALFFFIYFAIVSFQCARKKYRPQGRGHLQANDDEDETPKFHLITGRSAEESAHRVNERGFVNALRTQSFAHQRTVHKFAEYEGRFGRQLFGLRNHNAHAEAHPGMVS